MKHTIRRTREGYFFCAPRLRDQIARELAAAANPLTLSPSPATPLVVGTKP